MVLRCGKIATKNFVRIARAGNYFPYKCSRCFTDDLNSHQTQTVVICVGACSFMLSEWSSNTMVRTSSVSRKPAVKYALPHFWASKTGQEIYQQ